jgi:hypothetical protein
MLVAVEFHLRSGEVIRATTWSYHYRSHQFNIEEPYPRIVPVVDIERIVDVFPVDSEDATAALFDRRVD